MDGLTTQSTAATATDSLALRVVEAIATELAVDPIEIDPLYETVDPDAIEQLFAGDRFGGSANGGRVVFTHAGCDVTVYANDEVEAVRLTADESARAEAAGSDREPAVEAEFAEPVHD